MELWKKYQLPHSSRVKEGIEWSIHYAYNATDDTTPRVLLIGDSICNGYQNKVRLQLDGKVNVTFWASSKCVTDPTYLRELDMIMDDNRYTLISFNNGLHSLGTNRAEWETAYKNTVNYLHEKAPNAMLSITLCTPLQTESRNSTVVSLNEYIHRLAEECGYPLLDLYSPMDALDRNVYWSDVFHFIPDAIDIQAHVIAEHVLARIHPSNANAKHAATETGPSGKLI